MAAAATPTVLAPYTKDVTEAIASLPPDAHRVDVSGDPHDYWRAFAAAWHAGSGFVLVEHDIVLEPGVVDMLAACPEPWCLHPYTSGTFTLRAFGCVRFSAALTAALPDLPERVRKRHWHGLDSHVFYLLDLAGFVFHDHGLVLRHLNPSYEGR